MFLLNKKSILVSILIFSSTFNYAQAHLAPCDDYAHYVNCDVSSDCHFNIDANDGKCISLNNIAKPWQYNCKITGEYIQTIGTINYDDAKIQGIEISHEENSLNFTVNAQQAKVNLSHLHFNMEMPGDYPALDVILHCDRIP